MFEMLAAVLAGLFAVIYAVSSFVFTNGAHSRDFRIAFIVFIIAAFIIYKTDQAIRKHCICKMNVNLEDYRYYDKFTSPLYRVGYYLSYLIQNILYDYTYMSRNYNFCKGLDIYDGGVSEYYIKYRNTWYQYLKLTNLRHKISLKKLQMFACSMMNSMIMETLESEEEQEAYQAFQKEAEEFCGKYHGINNNNTVILPHYHDVYPLYRNNVVKYCRAQEVISRCQPKLVAMVERQSYHKDKDVNDYKKMKFR